MHNGLWQMTPIRSLLLGVFILLLSGCAYNLNLDRSSPPQVPLKDYQPIAILPIQETTRHPESLLNISTTCQELMAKKGYALVKPAEVIQALEDLKWDPEKIPADPNDLAKLSKHFKARLLMIGTLLDYRLQKPYVRSRNFQFWEEGLYEYRTLPTYHAGTLEMRLRLTLWAEERGREVWLAEGTARGPSSTADLVGKKLVERLLQDLPSLSPAQPD